MNSTNWVNSTLQTGAMHGEVTGLLPYSNYRFRVRALVTVSGTQKLSVPSDEIHLSTKESRKCSLLFCFGHPRKLFMLVVEYVMLSMKLPGVETSLNKYHLS